jgi:hypothetical protein
VVELPIDRKEITAGPGDAGWWKLTLEDTGVGVTDDVYVDLGDEIPQWLSLDPQQALSVRER